MDFQPHHVLGNFSLLDEEDENFDYQLKLRLTTAYLNQIRAPC